jgi:Predicted nucleoside-diphosphate-sugar epimerases
MTIVVFGGTGKFGGQLISELLKEGTEMSTIRAAGIHASKLHDFRAEGIEAVFVDYTNRETLKAALDGADTVFLISTNNLAHRREQNAAVVREAKRAGIERIAYASLLNAQKFHSIMAPDHKATEDLILESGMDYLFFRNGWFTENFFPLVAAAKETGEIVGNAGKGRVASATRADYAEAAAKIMTGPIRKRVYEFGGQPAWDLAGLAAATSKVFARPVQYRDVRPEEHLEYLISSGHSHEAQFQTSLDTDIRGGRLDTPSKDLEEVLGRKSTSLEEAIAKAWLAGEATTSRLVADLRV